MDVFELVQELKNIVNKLENDVELNKRESEIFFRVVLVLIDDVIMKSFDLVYNIMKEDKK